MTVSYRLRPATAGDAESIAALHTASWQRTYRGMMPDAFLDGGALENRRRVWRERLGSPNGDRHVVVAERESRLVGFICTFAREDEGWGAYIDNLHVAHEWQGRGIGRALMQSAAEWVCETQPGAAVYLWVMEANAPARAFYERLGAYNAETVDKSDPGGGSAPNCRYVWRDPRLLITT